MEELKEGTECCQSAVFRQDTAAGVVLSLSAVLITCRHLNKVNLLTHEAILLLQDLYTVNGWW